MIRKGNITTAELTATEKRVLLALGEEGGEWNQRNLSEKTGINEDAVMQNAFMLAQEGLLKIKEDKKLYYRLTDEGNVYAGIGLPERRLLNFLKKRSKEEIDILDLREEFGVISAGALIPEAEVVLAIPEATIAITWILNKKWGEIKRREEKKRLVLTGIRSCLPPEVRDDDKYSEVDLYEEILRIVREAGGEIEENTSLSKVKEIIPEIENTSTKSFLDDLMRRNLLESESHIERKITITEAGKEVLSQGISVEEEIAQLTPELLRTGSWRGRKFKRYDVNLASKDVFPAKIHPYQRLLDRMRRIFTEMGFVEIKGEVVQSAFWNFDALFVPQDHPAREMHHEKHISL